FSVEGGGYPIVALQHLARDLRIARLIGSHQPKCPQSVKKEEHAEDREIRQLAGGVSGLSHVSGVYQWSRAQNCSCEETYCLCTECFKAFSSCAKIFAVAAV